MSTLTVAAKDLAKGDLVTLSGEPFGVILATTFAHEPGMVTVYLCNQNGKQVGALGIGEDRLLSVDRPDPDAELIEVMARAIKADDNDRGRWVADEYYTSNARAALAAARKVGAL